MHNEFIKCLRIIAHLKTTGADYQVATMIEAAIGEKKRCAESELQTMRQKGLLEACRGPAGGYRLSERGKKADAFTVWRICHPTVNGPKAELARYWRDVMPEAVL